MSKVEILLVEDVNEEATILKQFLEDNQCLVVGIAKNLKEACGLYYSLKPDVVIIDVFLNGQPDGITFARTINENKTTQRPFVFLTNSTDRLIFENAKLTQPHSYLIKPFNELELQYAIESAIEKFADGGGCFSMQTLSSVMFDQCFYIKKQEALIKVPIIDIQYIEVDGKYCTIISDQETFLIELSLKQLMQKLPEIFIRTHRNMVVNKDKIKKVVPLDNLILLENNKQVILSRRYRQHFLSSCEILK